MAYIGRDPQYGAFEKQTLTGDGSTVTFNLDYTVGSASSILVSVAGVHQEPESAYNLSVTEQQLHLQLLQALQIQSLLYS